MRKVLLLGLLGVLAIVGVPGTAPSGSAATQTAAIWGGAVEVTGRATLNSSGAVVDSVSCAAAGDCAAGGSYVAGSGGNQAFVVSETNGSWADAIEVPGTATLNTNGSAAVDSISCAAVGDCAAGGYYVDGSDGFQAFVVSETNGSWGDAIEVPGTATLNSGGGAEVLSVSCAAAGDCAAGGSYTDGSDVQAFVVSETNGSWGDAIEVPGTATLNTRNARVGSISCAAAGDCAAGGYYTDGSNHHQAFVASETNGSWADAIEMPGTATLNSGGRAEVLSVSCAAAGDCAAGGSYKNGTRHHQAFVVGGTNGNWGDAIEVPGTATLNSGGGAELDSISCAAAGDCAAGGYYTDGSGHFQAFVIIETNGSWGDAIEVPGTTSPCVVPKVVGKALPAAKKKLKAAHCGVGTIKKVYSKVKRGRVVAQHPKAGRHLKSGAKVALTVSRGRKS